MKRKLMITEGYQIESEKELEHAVDSFIHRHPDFIHDGARKKDIIKLYRKRTKPYRHVVFIQMDDNWFLQFLTDEEVLRRIPTV